MMQDIIAEGDEIFTFCFANGRVAETWAGVDLFSQMKQLGMIQL